MSFRLISCSDEKWKAEGALPIAASGDGNRIQVGDDIYVLSQDEPSRLLARLSVLGVKRTRRGVVCKRSRLAVVEGMTDIVQPDAFRHRIDLTVGGPRSAVFFDNSSDAIQIRLPSTESNLF